MRSCQGEPGTTPDPMVVFPYFVLRFNTTLLNNSSSSPGECYGRAFNVFILLVLSSVDYKET